LDHVSISHWYFGCGLVIPEHVEGTKILDLGSGSGRDCFAVAKLVGETGHVTGLDMTPEQLEIANKYIEYHWKACGFSGPNVDFVQGYMEKMDEAGIKNDFYDIVISNCVLNLSPDKPAVLRQSHQVLKDGGEIYFSDIYSDQVVPDHIRKDKLLYGECLGGALWWEDLIRIAEECGFARPQLVTAHMFETKDEAMIKLLGDIKFVSATYRIFKLPVDKEAEPCKATYLGNIIGYPDAFTLNGALKFEKEKEVAVDANTAAILKTTRFSGCFTFKPLSCCENKNVESPNPVDPFVFGSENRNEFEEAQLACPYKPNVAGCCAK